MATKSSNDGSQIVNDIASQGPKMIAAKNVQISGGKFTQNIHNCGYDLYYSR